MASRLGWFNDEGQEVMEQDLVASLSPGPMNGETFMDLHSTFRPTGNSVTLGKTNFGFLAIRVARNISAHFGGGQLTNSHGMKGEQDIFGQSAEWMDYSGPVPIFQENGKVESKTEGITYFDHPNNPRYPTHWHVRVDGWMGASFNLLAPYTITKEKPLTLRYLLHAHDGDIDMDRASDIQQAFAGKPGYIIRTARDIPHQQFEVERVTTK